MSGTTRLYSKVAEYLKERIDTGVIRPNSRMPSERVLAEQFGVSRVTVRQALKDLELAGVVEVDGGVRLARGSGGISDREASAKSIEEGATGLVSFSDLAAANGLTATSLVLSNVTRPSTLDEADLLGIAPGAAIVDLVRLRQLDGVPTLIDYSLLPESLAPGVGKLDFARASLYHTLADSYGLHAVRADCIIESRGASGEVAAQLGLSPGAPVLVIIQTTFGDNGRIIQWCRSVYRGDRYRFRAILDGIEGGQRLRPVAPESSRRSQSSDRTKEPAA
jgi:GntR family transcriptional regulator